MVIQFNTLQPQIVMGDICGTTSFANIASAGMQMHIQVDGEDIINTFVLPSDVSSYDGVANKVSVALTNGKTVEFWRDTDNPSNNKFRIDLSYLNGVNDLWLSSQVYIRIFATGYPEYSNTFTVYNFDIGNAPTLNDLDGNPINYNPEFDIHLVPDSGNWISGVQVNAYSHFTAYRQPFGNQVHVYNLTNCDPTITYTIDGDTVLNVANGNVSTDATKETFTMYQVHTLANGDVCSKNYIVAKQNYVPTFDLELTCVNCDDDCTNILATNTANPNIDWNSMTTFHTGQTALHPVNNIRLTYQLFNKDGGLTDSYVTNFQLNEYPTTQGPNDHAWSGFTVPTAGTYTVRCYLEVFGINTDGVDLSNVALTTGEWYVITKNPTANSDFTLAGSISNNAGTAFNYNGGGIIWKEVVSSPAGIVQILDQSVASCRQTETLTACNYVDLQEGDCGTYTLSVHNQSGITYSIFKIKDATTFETTATTTGAVNGLAGPGANSTTITLEDGVYKIVVDPVDQDGDGDQVTYTVVVYCSLLSCYFDYLQGLICKDEECCDACKERLYKKYHDFFGLNMHSHVFFNLLNGLYGVDNYFFTALDQNTIKDMWDMQTYLDKFVRYCADCSTDLSEKGIKKSCCCT